MEAPRVTSANKTLARIVYSRGLVPKEHLQNALIRATQEGLSLEKVLVDTGILQPQDCSAVLQIRAGLGRGCSACGHTNYLLPDQSDAIPCEACGTPLNSAQAAPPQQQQQHQPAPHEAAPAQQAQAADPTQAIEAWTQAWDQHFKQILESLPQQIAQLTQDVVQQQVPQITAQILQAVEARLQNESQGQGGSGPPPEEIAMMASSQALAAVEERLAQSPPGGGPPPEQVAQMAASQILPMVEERLAAIGGQGGGGPPPEQVAQIAASQILPMVEERLAALNHAGGGGGPNPEEISRIAFEHAILAVDQRLQELGVVPGQAAGGGGGVDPQVMEETARRVAQEIVESRMASTGTATGVDDKKATASYNKKFLALAREVKGIKTFTDKLKKKPLDGPAEGGAAPVDANSLLEDVAFRNAMESRIKALVGSTANPNIEALIKADAFKETLEKTIKTFLKDPSQASGVVVVKILNSNEFKEAFDTKVNQVLGYIKSDVVPKAVKKAMGQ